MIGFFMKKILMNIICCIMCISTVQGMKRQISIVKFFCNNVYSTVKTTKSLMPLTSEQRTNRARLVDYDVLIDEIQTNIALHLIVDFLLMPKTIKAHTDIIYSIAIQDDKLVTGSGDGTAKIWDIHSHNLLHILAGPNGHTDQVWSVAIQDNKVITTSRDHTAKIWNANTGELLYTLTKPNDHTEITSVKINGDKIITGSFDHTAKIWNIHTGKLLRTFEGHMNYVTSVAITDEKVVTQSIDGVIKIWCIHTGKLLHTIAGPKIYFDMITSNHLLITPSDNDSRAVKIWNIHTGQPLCTLAGPRKHTKSIASIAVNKNHVITGSHDHTIKIWPLQLDLNTEEFANPNHALFWIKHYILPYQAHLIARAYATQKLIINSKSDDALTWITFPAHVREYLQTHLNIRLTK